MTDAMTDPMKTTATTRNFWVPRKLVQDCRLMSLSHDALKLFVYLGYITFRRQTNEVILSHYEFNRVLGIHQSRTTGIRDELVAAGLIVYSHGPGGITYSFVRDVPAKQDHDIVPDVATLGQ